MTTHPTIDLQAGELRLTLDPATGGAIAGLRFRGVDLLRPVCDPRLAAQLQRKIAAYPLIPYANRIACGRFSFAGQGFQLARNFGQDPHTIHGNAWMHAWSVTERTDRRVSLVFDHAPEDDLAAEWPFAYRAEQIFVLRDDAVTVTLSVCNTDDRPWPAGLGLHPYVARTPQTVLRFGADTVWLTDAAGLPTTRQAVQGTFEFADGAILGKTEIDNCYAGWDGTATILFPEHDMALTLTSGPPMDHLQLYTPGGCDYLGLEPASNMPDAINRMGDIADQGLVVLEPGETLRATITIAVRGDRDIEGRQKVADQASR